MFDLLDRPLHWIPVKWPALIAPSNESDVSSPGSHEIELRVEILDREECIWRFPGFFGNDRPPHGTPPQGCEDPNDPSKWGEPPELFANFKRIVRDWRKIKAGGRRVEMNDENIRLLLASPMFEAGFSQAYIFAVGGQAEVREKNSDASPSDGLADTGEATPVNSSRTASAGE